MVNRVSLEPAFVLHRRPYSNTSLLLDLLTQQHGRMTVLARSARGLKSRYRGRLDLFSPMLVSWSGRGELKTLGAVEFSAAPFILTHDALLCGFYLNEVLIRLLHSHDPCVKLFTAYQTALTDLDRQCDLQITLRCFEKKLLHELGYGLIFDREWQTNTPIQPENYYHYVAERGFTLAPALTPDVFTGACLLALHHEQFDNPSTFKDAKRLMRLVLKQYLGKKPLKSRELLR